MIVSRPVSQKPMRILFAGHFLISGLNRHEYNHDEVYMIWMKSNTSSVAKTKHWQE